MLGSLPIPDCRRQAFAEWAADRPESTIIVGGHSLWFRNFFTLFLPKV